MQIVCFFFVVCLPKNVQCEWLDRQNVIHLFGLSHKHSQLVGAGCEKSFAKVSLCLSKWWWKFYETNKRQRMYGIGKKREERKCEKRVGSVWLNESKSECIETDLLAFCIVCLFACTFATAALHVYTWRNSLCKWGLYK